MFDAPQRTMNNNRASTIKDYVVSLAAPSIGEAFRPGGFTPSRRLLSLGFTIADLIEVRLSADSSGRCCSRAALATRGVIDRRLLRHLRLLLIHRRAYHGVNPTRGTYHVQACRDAASAVQT